jgi:phosphatidylethanolamine-binding protein (PEBP) family uncharacterized protein
MGGAGMGGDAGVGGTPGGTGGDGGTGGMTAFELTSPGLVGSEDCSADARDTCPLFTCEQTNPGGNESPGFSWTAGPPGTMSYALVMQDLVFMPQGEPYPHWTLWNIPASVTALQAMLGGGAMPAQPAGASQVSQRGDNSFAGSGGCGNVYEFVLLALSVPTFTASDSGDPDTVRDELLASTDILERAVLRIRSIPDNCGC